MKIEAGKYYRRRDGGKEGPIVWRPFEDGYEYGTGKSHWWNAHGKVKGHDPEFDLIAEWTDEPAAPKTWSEMTDAQKGALLLAHYKGKVIEAIEPANPSDRWDVVMTVGGLDCIAYRVRPPEPVRETVTLHGRLYVIKIYPDGIWDFDRNPAQSDDTHRITFDTIDGEPDCESIRMERIND